MFVYAFCRPAHRSLWSPQSMKMAHLHYLSLLPPELKTSSELQVSMKSRSSRFSCAGRRALLLDVNAEGQ